MNILIWTYMDGEAVLLDWDEDRQAFVIPQVNGGAS
jgi:hypothetical protein